ncbi:hypothetical protein K8I61_12405 [bacterium]|nr:hypothetical protein [bacterium]
MDYGLGKGADAAWADSGKSDLDAGGECALTTVVIDGRPDEAMAVEINVFAMFGPNRIPIFKNSVTVTAEERVTIPVDLTPAVGYYEKQAAYVTTVHARLTELRGDGKPGYTKALPSRYLAWHKSASRIEALDAAELKKTYPGGVFGAEERAMFAALAAEEKNAVPLWMEPPVTWEGWTGVMPDKSVLEGRRP